MNRILIFEKSPQLIFCIYKKDNELNSHFKKKKLNTYQKKKKTHRKRNKNFNQPDNVEYRLKRL